MKAGHNQLEIAQILERHRSTISREVNRNSGIKGYRPKQAQELACQRAEGSRNAPRVPEATLQVAAYFLRQDWSPEQVAELVPVSHETLYRYIYADRDQGGTLWRGLRCQKKKRKYYAGGRDRPAAVEARGFVGHWEGDTVIGAAHKQAIVTVVERKSGFTVLSKDENKTSEDVGQAIINRLKPYAARRTTLLSN